MIGKTIIYLQKQIDEAKKEIEEHQVLLNKLEHQMIELENQFNEGGINNEQSRT